MSAAEAILALLQLSRMAQLLVEQYHRGELTEEELTARWKAMQARLGDVSERIQG